MMIAVLVFALARPSEAQQVTLPIGEIQGEGEVSPYLNRFVNFRGVVVGRYEDENTRGIVYYTLFVQDLPGETDGNPATSDAIAVFLGREPRNDIPIGAQVRVGGKVTEFFGLTEIDDDGLVVSVENPATSLPPPVLIDPPADMAEQAEYFERLESMRVAFADEVVVAGPTHEGCGFAVIDAAVADTLPAVRRAADDPVGRVVPVLYPSDRECDEIPQVKTGDRITGMAGALTYNFDQFKIVFDSAEQLTIQHAEMEPIPALPPTDPSQIILASINAEDYFDTVRDTDEEGEPVLTTQELDARRAKMTYFIAQTLSCPTLVALQEVEHEALLADLSAALADPCGFAYQVSHLESPDARGIDNAMLSDPRRVQIEAVTLRQACSPVPTEVTDPLIACAAGEEPLFGRPPLHVEARIDDVPYHLFVNHFKSKRGGEIETDLERIRQAVVLNGLSAALLAADPDARLIALGDFNDNELSPALLLLTDPAQGGVYADPLDTLPVEDRYTYNFGGVVEQIDIVLLSPALIDEVAWVGVRHANTDFPSGWRLDTSPERLPFRVSDHDVPVVILGQWPATPEAERMPTDTPTATLPSPTATHAARPSATPEQVLDLTMTAVDPESDDVTADRQPVEARPGNPDRRLLFAAAAAVILLTLIFLRLRR